MYKDELQENSSVVEIKVKQPGKQPVVEGLQLDEKGFRAWM